MNILFAGAGNPPVSQGEGFAPFAQLVEKRFGGSVERVFDGDNGSLFAGVCGDSDGVILGQATARDGQVALLFLGCLNGPAPDASADDFDGGTPLDSPRLAAQYLLRRYLDTGDSFLADVIGQYVVVVLDKNEKKLVMGCDPTGLRTLFYHQKDGRLLLCSNVSTLAAAVPQRALDREYEDFFLCYGFFPHGHTPYDGISQLKPGQVVTFCEGKLTTKVNKAETVWSGGLADFNFEKANEAQAIDALHDAFMLASQEQLASSNKAAVLLGGLDSALVAAVLHRLGKEVETFSFYYDDEAFNQPHTDTLAKFLGIKHNWVRITPENIGQGIADYSAKFNFPTNWLNYVVQTEHLCQVIKQAGFKYIYSGDGCDGTFLGYPRVHFIANLLSKAGPLGSLGAGSLVNSLNLDVLEYNTGRPYTVLMQALSSLGRKGPERYYSTFKVIDENSLARLKGGDAKIMRARNEQILAEVAAPFAQMSMDRLAYAGKNALSPNRSKMAGSSDSTGVVINTPYLHSGMKQFALRIPDELLRPQGAAQDYKGKYILFKMCEVKKLLPDSITYQKKISAVDAPVDAWYNGELQGQIRDALGGLPFGLNERRLARLFRRNALEQAYSDKVASDALTSHALCLLTTYSRFTNLDGIG